MDGRVAEAGLVLGIVLAAAISRASSGLLGMMKLCRVSVVGRLVFHALQKVVVVVLALLWARPGLGRLSTTPCRRRDVVERGKDGIRESKQAARTTEIGTRAVSLPP